MTGSAHFSYSRFFAVTTVPIAFVVLMIPLALVIGGIYILITEPQGPQTQQTLTSIGGVGVGVWMLVTIWQWIRYRHALWERYTLDRYGVRVESAKGAQQIPWADFERGEYLIIPGMIRLTTKLLERPVFLFLDRRPFSFDQDEERNAIAKTIICQSMSGRYHRRWML